MVMIEHFSKRAIVLPLQDKELKKLASLFQERVICTFLTPQKVITGQGTEFQEAFLDMLDTSLIDHRRTSRNYPQTNGLGAADQDGTLEGRPR